MTTTQMLEELRKKSYEQLWRHGTNDEYILHNVAVIGSSPEVGFKSSLSRDEIEEAYGPEGLITSHIARSQKLHDRSQNRPTKAKKISQVSGVLYELVRSVYCNVAHGTDEACQVQGVIFRFQHESSNTRGLLYYAKCNPLNGLIIDHSSHHLFPGEIAKLECKSRQKGAQTKPKSTPYSLSRQQEEALIQEFKGRNPTTEQVSKFVEGWKYKPQNELRTSAAQDNEVNKLVSKCIGFIQNSKRSYKKATGSDHRYFSEDKTNTDLTSEQLLKVVEILSTPAGSPERKRKYNASDSDSFPYLASSNFKICCERILITDHDCDGKMWTYFLVEYLHSSELGEKAKEMHPDGKVQVSCLYMLHVQHLLSESDYFIILIRVRWTSSLAYALVTSGKLGTLGSRTGIISTTFSASSSPSRRIMKQLASSWTELVN